MITIFSHVKAFQGIFDIIQNNAIRSWRSISEDLEIIIFGDVFGAREICSEINATHIYKVMKSSNGMPKLNHLFNEVRKNSRYSQLCYINADIILPNDFLKQTMSLLKFKKYLGIGNRYDTDFHKRINFNNDDWWDIHIKEIKHKGKWHQKGGADYFLFNKSIFLNMPDVYLGLPGSDNWLIWEARRNRIPVIDLTDSIMAIHQNHDYSHLDSQGASGKSGYKYYEYGNEANHNRKLVSIALNLNDANWYSKSSKIKKKTSKEFLNRNFNKLPFLFPKFSYLIIFYKKVLRKLGFL